MPPIRMGVVGLSRDGWATTALIPPLFHDSLKEKYTLTALSTTSEASALEAAKKFTKLAGHEVTAYHGDTSRISQDENVDLVVVSVRAPSHKHAVLPAIAAGKDVFVEWPAGIGSKETCEIAQAAREKGVRSMVGMQGRLSPQVRKLRELVASGKIGKVISTSIIALAPRELLFWGPWINERNTYITDATSGATLLEVAVGHLLDSFTSVLGGFTSVSATSTTQYPIATLYDASHEPTGQTIPVTAADHIAFTGLLDSGAIASVNWRSGHASSPGRRQFVWEIDGEAGTIRVENDDIGGAFLQVKVPKVYLNNELVLIEDDGVPGNMARAWLEFAKGSNGPFATFEDAVRIHKLLDAIEQSAQLGKRIILE